MTFDDITTTAINPALALLPKRMDSPEARIMILATGQHESKFRSRWQILNGGKKGLARGFHMFEREGGVRELMIHVASRGHLRKLCEARSVEYELMAIWRALEKDDVLDAGMARLLLFIDPAPLPAVDDFMGAYAYYLRSWRPGKKRAKEWPAEHERARAFVTGD